MKRGIIIEEGPQNWQIMQQQDGKADIFLAGKYYLPADAPDGAEPRVFGRLLQEDTGRAVTGWLEAAVEGNGWRLTIPGVRAGGLYRVETSLRLTADGAMEWNVRGDMIHHVGVGDVYVIAGQSNSAGYGKDPVYDPPEIGVHLFRNSGVWDLASHPFNDSTGTIHEENSEGANPGHSPYLAFARTLKRELGYPIGLLQTSLGGSPLKSWNPEEEPVLYDCMMRVIRSQGGKVRGILWYQGCSDTGAAQCGTYRDRFEAFVRHCRQDLDDPQLPVLTVQLNRVTDHAPGRPEDEGWSVVREQQRQAALTIPGVTVVPACDCGLSDAIHNSAPGNITLGERLANMALRTVYGREDVAAFAPDVCSIRSAKGGRELTLTFDHVTDRLYSFLPELPFTVWDGDGKIAVRDGKIEQNRIILSLMRPAGTDVTVSALDGANPCAFPLIDVYTHLPMLAFQRGTDTYRR